MGSVENAELIMVQFLSGSVPALSFSFTGREGGSLLGFIQEIISRLFQAHCRRPVPLHSAPKHTFSTKKKQGCVCVFVFYCLCVFLFVFGAHTSVQQQSRVWGKKKIGVR